MSPSPPDFAVERAVNAARLSPCQKSKRGAVVYQPQPFPVGLAVVAGWGYNGQPSGACDGTCRARCGKLCVHAEQRAIARAVETLAIKRAQARERPLSGWSMVHAKVIDGSLVAGGPPSCWQCSRLVLESGLDGVWLFEADPAGPEWRWYKASDFHAETQANAILAELATRQLSGEVER